MAKISIEKVKRIREETGAPVVGIKRALEEAGGDEKKAKEILRKEGFKRAEKKAEREIRAGEIFVYVHHSKQVGALVDLGCETDFVARTDEFQNLGKEIAMQVASMNPENVDELLEQEYIREPGKKIADLIKEVIAKTGENIKVEHFERHERTK